MTDAWSMPSPEATEIIRTGARQALSPKPEWLTRLYDVVLEADRLGVVASDPVLAEGTRRANLSNLLHWAQANVERPGARVRPNLSPDVLNSTRDIVRRDLDSSVLDSWRLGQSAAWEVWMEICFELTPDAALLREVLAITARSISTFIDETIRAVAEVIDQERTELAQGNEADRRATIALLLEGAPVPRGSAEARLGYPLTGSHLAAVVWGENTTGAALGRSVDALATYVGATRRLTVTATGSSLWIWLQTARSPVLEGLAPVLADHGDVRVALGRPRADLEGFRKSHLEATAIHRLMATHGSRQIGVHQDAHLVELAGRDVGASDEFIADTLGDLAHAAPELRSTLLAYARSQCNAAKVAERLYTHRNTVLRRLARCDELLPRPFAEDPVQVAAALDLLAWRA